MDVIVIKKLEAKLRIIATNEEQIEIKTAAFIGATDEEQLCEFGIGLIAEDGQCWFWGLLCPHCLMTAWRGVQILDQLQIIEHGTICHAYYATQRQTNSDTIAAIGELGKQFPEIEKKRMELLATKIPNEELEAMLEICNSPDNAIDLATWELRNELKAGAIERTEGVLRVFENATERMLESLRKEEFCKRPLAEKRSFRALCQNIGIKRLVTLSERGDCMDKSLDMERLDEIVIREALSTNSPLDVWMTENSSPDDFCGQIGHPVLKLDDGRLKVLYGARYYDDQMAVALGEINAKPCHEDWVPVSQITVVAPQLVGITNAIKWNSSWADIERGYKKLRTPKSKRCLFARVVSAVSGAK